MTQSLRRFFLVLVGAVALGGQSATALAGPCGITKRIRFADDVGNDSLNDVFAKAQSIAKRSLDMKVTLKAGKCELMKLAKAEKWGDTMKRLRKTKTKDPKVAAAAKKLKGNLPGMEAITKLAADAKAIDQKMKSLTAVTPDEKHKEAYEKNTKALTTTVAQAIALQIQIPTLKEKMDKLIAKHGE